MKTKPLIGNLKASGLSCNTSWFGATPPLIQQLELARVRSALRRLAFGVMFAAAVVATTKVQAQFYNYNFEGVVGPEWSRQQTDVTPEGHRRFLGQFGNDTVSLTLTNLRAHRGMTVSFDLFVINTWDGNSPAAQGGPDIWDLSVAGGPTLLHTTFQLFDGSANQSFPDNYPGGNHSARTGAVENNTLGFSYADSVYHLVFTFPHTADAVTLSFSGIGLQDIGDESWGLDNVNVSIDLLEGCLYMEAESGPISLPTLAVLENGGQANVSVLLLRGTNTTDLAVSVNYATIDGTAHAGEDYMATSGTLHFAAGETNKEIQITILDDSLKERKEQFLLMLSNPTGGLTLGNSNVVIHILSDELLPYYVNVNNPNPVFPYDSWATAATNIQDAVDAAETGDLVLVTNGVYATGGKTNAWGYLENRVSITKPIRLESVNGPLVTIIDGVSTRDEDGYVIDGRRCVYLGSNAVLSGFTLTNGAAPWGGGGVLCEPSGIVTNCTVSGNIVIGGSYWSGCGGGVYGGNLYNCTLTDNSAIARSYWTTCSGGGVYGSTLYNCTLTGNSAQYGGGASSSTLYNCTVTDNLGGGTYESTLYNCTVVSNNGGVSGTLYNCLITDNNGGSGGEFFNCTIVGNNGGVSGTLYNSIVYYNYGGNYDEWTVLNFSCTTPLPTNGVGNIIGPPLFMDFAAGDYRLWENSPCIDAGTNLLGLVIVSSVNPDTGEPILVPYTYASTDILGNTRFIDGDFDGVVAWDIGAYEFDSFKPPRFSCPPQLMPNCWRLNITGAHNQWVRLQRSSDLQNWEDLYVPGHGYWFFMGSEGVKQVDDVDLSQNAMFYRAVVD